MKVPAKMSKKYITTLQDKGLYDSNNYGANYLGTQEKRAVEGPSDGSKMKQYQSAVRVMNKQPTVGMNHGTGAGVSFPKANTFR